jgi:hypothetical protein
MENPWTELPFEAPFVLPYDQAAVERFNISAGPEFQLRLNVLPEPFLGNPKAPVVLLGLNPGYAESDIPIHTSPSFASANRRNLCHTPSDYPFYLLHPDLVSPGQIWWQKHLKQVIQAAGVQRVANSIFVIEYLGYHSIRFKHHEIYLPSQLYSRELVREAIRRNALIVLQRGVQLWKACVPELATYSRAFFLNSYQNPTVSPRNCPKGFEEICAAVNGGA